MSGAEIAIMLDMRYKPSDPVYVKGAGLCDQVPLCDKMDGSPLNAEWLRRILRDDCDYIICTNQDLYGKTAWLMPANENDPSNILRAYSSASGLFLEFD